MCVTGYVCPVSNKDVPKFIQYVHLVLRKSVQYVRCLVIRMSPELVQYVHLVIRISSKVRSPLSDKDVPLDFVQYVLISAMFRLGTVSVVSEQSERLVGCKIQCG